MDFSVRIVLSQLSGIWTKFQLKRGRVVIQPFRGLFWVFLEIVQILDHWIA